MIDASKIIFKETQAFRQKWLWALLLLANASVAYGAIETFRSGAVSLSSPTGVLGVGFPILILLVIDVLFYIVRLETVLTKTEIHFRFYPFQRKYKTYTWDQFEKVYVRQYSPIKEYGGWGLRSSFMGKNKAYNVAGSMGLQLDFKNKNKTLVGTQKPKELDSVIKNTLRF